MSSASSLLLAGAGDLGSRLAGLRAACGDEVIVLRRRDRVLPGTRLLRADLDTGEGLARLPGQVEALVFCVAPDARDEAAYRRLYRDGLRRLLDATDVGRVIFVSSTAVYGQDAGEWVSEGSASEAPAFNGRVLLEAEAEIQAHAQGVTLRLSGLYGPGREALLRRAREGLAARRHWTNRIHVEDAASALSHLLDLPAPQRLYLGNDDAPVFEHEVQDWLRQREGLDAVAVADDPVSGRRIANTRLRASGWRPVHSDFRSGYSSLL